MIDVQFNNILGSNIGIYMKAKPSIPAARELVQETSVPGRDGVLLIRKGIYEQTQIPVEFNYIGPEEQWGKRWREAKKWLSAVNTELKFSDDPTVFYKIRRVIVNENEKRGNRVGVFSATFITTDGLSYLDEGNLEYDSTEKLYNLGIVSKPIYKLTGDGLCTLTVNGAAVKVNVSGDITIDTEKMVAYRSDGTSQNIAVSGDYEDLYLQEGENTVTVTNDFQCKVIPRWRCL